MSFDHIHFLLQLCPNIPRFTHPTFSVCVLFLTPLSPFCVDHMLLREGPVLQSDLLSKSQLYRELTLPLLLANKNH